MGTVMYRVIRDGTNLVWCFYGADLAEVLPAFAAFGDEGRWANTPAVYVHGIEGDRMPGDVACGWLRDRGVEPVRVR